MTLVKVAYNGSWDNQTARTCKPLDDAHKDKKLDILRKKYKNRAYRVDDERDGKWRFSAKFIADWANY